MTGQELRNRLNTILLNGEKINFTVLSERLGLKNSQALYSKLKAQNVHDYFVADIAKALHVTVDDLLSNKPILTVKDTDINYNPKKTDNNLDSARSLFQKLDEVVRPNDDDTELDELEEEAMKRLAEARILVMKVLIKKMGAEKQDSDSK